MPEAKHTYLKTHALSGEVLSIDIKGEQGKLLQKAQAGKAGRAATTLVKEGALRITLMAVRKGVALQEHQVAGGVSLHILRGGVHLEAGGRALELRAGHMAVLASDVKHRVTAASDSVILITMSMD